MTHVNITIVHLLWIFKSTEYFVGPKRATVIGNE